MFLVELNCKYYENTPKLVRTTKKVVPRFMILSHFKQYTKNVE